MLKNVIRSLSDRMFLRMFARSLDGKWRIPLRLAKRIVLSVVFIRKNSLVLINGNRFVSVKKKKKILAAMERERDADFSLLFIHIPSVSLPSINSIDFALSSKFHPRASVLIRHRCSPYFSPPTIARLIQRAAFVSAYFIDFAELSLF